MLHHDIFHSISPERIRFENIVLSPDEKKPIVVSKPSDFSIDHILNNAGSSSKDKCSTVDDNKSSSDNSNTRDCYLLDSNVHQYPPILNWLQYSRYKPPRLPRKHKTHTNKLQNFNWKIHLRRNGSSHLIQIEWWNSLKLINFFLGANNFEVAVWPSSRF